MGDDFHKANTHQPSAANQPVNAPANAPPTQAPTQARVQSAVAKTRAAQKQWRNLDTKTRAQFLLCLRDRLLDARSQLAHAISLDTGKHEEEAWLTEIALVCGWISLLAAQGPALLEPKPISSWLSPSWRSLMPRRATQIYAPLGVVAVISPWNFPLAIPMASLLPAWLAGNACIHKPSEYAPHTAAVVAACCRAAGFLDGLYEKIDGDKEVAQALLQFPDAVDKVDFTGGTLAGRAVAKACAEQLIPCTLELGGKTPAIVLDDIFRGNDGPLSTFERTAQALVAGGFFYSGQACIAIERVYVIDNSEHFQNTKRLVERCTEILRAQNQHSHASFHAPLRLAHAPYKMQLLCEDAVSQGAHAFSVDFLDPDPTQNRFPPTILYPACASMRVMQDEIFGPLLPICPVSTLHDAVQQANHHPAGLCAAVFGDDRHAAQQVAMQIEAGMVVVNDTLLGYAMPDVPFGGVKKSGYGRVHGAQGLYAMCQERVVVSEKYPLPREFWWQPMRTVVDLLPKELLAQILKKLS